MKIEEKKIRITPKRIVFNIDEADHQTIKQIAAKNRITMRQWIFIAMREALKRQTEVVE